MKEIDFLIKHQGDASVNGVVLLYKSKDVILLEVNLHTKYAGIAASCGNSFMIETYEHSLHKTDERGFTWVLIPEAEGYTFFSGSGGRYTLRVTFVKDSIYNE